MDDKIFNVIVGSVVLAAFVLWIVRVQTKNRLMAKNKTETTDRKKVEAGKNQ